MTTNEPDRATLRAAVALATHAPSVHNTQPWRWSIDGGSVHLHADRDRRLPATDPDGRDLLISCGAALHHLRVALAAAGWAAVVHRLPDPARPDQLAVVRTRPHQPGERDLALAAAIRRRRTDRRRMSDLPVPPDQVEALARLARHEGASGTVITDPAARFHLAGAIAQAAVVGSGDPVHTAETAPWGGTGGPPAGQPRAVRRGTLTAGRSYGQRTEYLVVATPGDDTFARLRAGEAASAVLLGATDLGLATCPLSRPLEIADTRRVIRDDVLGGTAVPQLVVRLGWAPPGAAALPRAPRRDPDEVIGVAR